MASTAWLVGARSSLIAFSTGLWIMEADGRCFRPTHCTGACCWGLCLAGPPLIAKIWLAHHCGFGVHSLPVAPIRRQGWAARALSTWAGRARASLSLYRQDPERCATPVASSERTPI